MILAYKTFFFVSERIDRDKRSSLLSLRYNKKFYNIVHQVILKNVSRHLSGQYVCSAANTEGDGFSRPLLITINYKPYCVAPTIQVIHCIFVRGSPKLSGENLEVA